MEFFAVAMETFFMCLSGRLDWKNERSREALLPLIGLNHLFRTYKVETIGKVKKSEALTFSRELFWKVLGINLDDVESVYPKHAKVLRGESIGQKSLSERYRQGLHTNFLAGTIWFPDLSAPQLTLGLELEYGRRGRDLPMKKQVVIVPALRYSVFGFESGDASDRLTVAAKLYLPGRTSFEVGLDVGNLFFDSGVDNPLPLSFGFHLGARWSIRTLGTTVELGPSAGMLFREKSVAGQGIAVPLYVGLDLTFP